MDRAARTIAAIEQIIREAPAQRDLRQGSNRTSATRSPISSVKPVPTWRRPTDLHDSRMPPRLRVLDLADSP
jgi:hypothetical protein